jgi:hypothetical protein
MSNGPDEEKGAGVNMNRLTGGFMVLSTFRFFAVTLGKDK